MKELLERFMRTEGESVERTFKEKRYVSSPDISMLTPDQLNAYNEMLAYLRGVDSGMFLFLGYAGTGKTFVLSKVTEKLLADSRTKVVIMSAPTNKAVRVMYDTADYYHPNLEYATTHGALGMKEDINDKGEQVFKKEWGNMAALDRADAMMIDEVSMLQDDLFFLIKEYVSEGVRVLFVGDPAQIPPVNHTDCIPFKEEWQDKLNITTVMLEEVVRQAKDSPIITLSMIVRENLDKSVMPIKRVSDIREDGSGVFFIGSGGEGNSDDMEAVLEFMFVNELFKKNADYSKVICYRNKTVDYVNDLVRKMIYGRNRRKIELGEKLYAHSPIFGDDPNTIIYPTNAEFEVLGYVIKEEKLNTVTELSLMYYEVEVFSLNSEGKAEKKKLKVIHEDSESLYKELLSTLYEFADATPFGSMKRKKAWKEYWSYKKRYASIAYNYAVTAHKSQGSTYVNAMVMESDIDLLRRVRERNRIKYTAITRPSKRLIMVRW